MTKPISYSDDGQKAHSSNDKYATSKESGRSQGQDSARHVIVSEFGMQSFTLSDTQGQEEVSHLETHGNGTEQALSFDENWDDQRQKTPHDRDASFKLDKARFLNQTPFEVPAENGDEQQETTTDQAFKPSAALSEQTSLDELVSGDDDVQNIDDADVLVGAAESIEQTSASDVSAAQETDIEMQSLDDTAPVLGAYAVQSAALRFPTDAATGLPLSNAPSDDVSEPAAQEAPAEIDVETPAAGVVEIDALMGTMDIDPVSADLVSLDVANVSQKTYTNAQVSDGTAPVLGAYLAQSDAPEVVVQEAPIETDEETEITRVTQPNVVAQPVAEIVADTPAMTPVQVAAPDDVAPSSPEAEVDVVEVSVPEIVVVPPVNEEDTSADEGGETSDVAIPVSQPVITEPSEDTAPVEQPVVSAPDTSADDAGSAGTPTAPSAPAPVVTPVEVEDVSPVVVVAPVIPEPSTTPSDDGDNSGKIIVSSRAELEEALSNTTGGEMIYLAEGDYGYLRLGHNGHVEFFGHEEKVTIASLDEDNPALFSRLFLAQVENLRIDGISFKADSAEDDSKEYTRSTVTIRSSDSIELVNSKIDGGNIPGEFYWGVNSVTTYKSDNLLIENNDISGGKLGIAIDTATNVIVRENYVHDILGDNLRVANDLENIYIEGNLLTSVDMDHELFSTHKDHIQFHTYNGTTSPKNIYIRDNILIQETGSTQGIFIRNEGEEKNGDMRYENVVIENNLIYNGHQHGIRISDVDDLSIQNNTLLYNGDGERAPRVYAHDATDAEIEKNVAYKVNLNDVELEGSNIIGDVNDLVIDDDLGRSVSIIERLSDLQVLPGSVLDNSDVGSTLNRFEAAPDQLTALIIKEDLDHLGAPDSFLFDASLSTSTQGFLNAANATFTWDFGDGTTAEGVVVTHSYAQPGDYEVTLTVTHADGQESTNTSVAEIAEPVLAVFDFDTQDVTDTSSYATTVKYSADDNLAEHYVQTGDGGYAYQLENGNGFEIISPHVQSQNQFSLSFDVQRNEIDSGGGTVFSMSGSFELSITHSGAIVVEVEQKDTEPYKLRTDNGVVNDLAWHNITLSYDDVANKMEIFLDGVSVAETAIDGIALESTGNHKFELGGKYSLQALIDNIEITASPVEDGTSSVKSGADSLSMLPVEYLQLETVENNVPDGDVELVSYLDRLIALQDETTYEVEPEFI